MIDSQYVLYIPGQIAIESSTEWIYDTDIVQESNHPMLYDLKWKFVPFQLR